LKGREAEMKEVQRRKKRSSIEEKQQEEGKQ
jgi:hypothetical protein